MCILFIYTNPNPEPNTYRLIIVSNRDEFYARPAKQICRIKDVIGGQDMEPTREGGMWLGVSIQRIGDCKFRFGALLNITGEEHKHGVKGRGFIVADYLNGESTADTYINSLLNDGETYNGFNFVAVEVSQGDTKTYCCGNISKERNKYAGAQVLGFGNTIPDTPLKKVIAGEARFKQIIEENNDVSNKEELLGELLSFLKWEERHLPDSNLEKRQPTWYKELSCVFVKVLNGGYGSRTHSIILIDYEWNMEFFEATMKEPIDINNPIWLSDTIKARL